VNAATASQIKGVNREELRMLVADLGYTEASKRTGVKRWTLYKWGQRYGWKSPIVHAKTELVQFVQSPAIAQADALQEHENATRMSLARTLRKHSAEAEKTNLGASGSVRNTVESAAKLYKWGQDSNAQAHFTLNTLNLNTLNIEIRE